ncbi:Blp family class II bacteriocin [uncultured Rummeliibacillus sp.]|uniref:Blp family class II bacteriocin n=1 Tax=uncultured Rummeliibacillus sp. TaxID=762292 RepID=UPI00261CA216|nr:Blp family class II bacteriocin [uncultured Rummeliibacillus sp.]
MYNLLLEEELTSVVGGKKKLACSYSDAISSGISGGITGIIGGPFGALGGAIAGAGNCLAGNFHGIH